MPKYLIRLDDACHQSNWDNWDKIQQLFSKYKIKPIVGVIPSNRDHKFKEFTLQELKETSRTKKGKEVPFPFLVQVATFWTIKIL